MNTMDASVEQKSIGKCLLDNWVEERATALLDQKGPRKQIHKHGHKGILTMDPAPAVQVVSTVKAAYTPPKGPGVRQRGIRCELLENYLLEQIRDQTHAEFNPEPANIDYRSTTKHDFTVEGFQSYLPSPTKEHDYKRDHAVTFWSENYRHVQRVTEVKSSDSPFKKNATFSTPISEQLDDPMLYTP